MSFEVARFVCRYPDCEQRFLTVDARNGHESVHANDVAPEVING